MPFNLNDFGAEEALTQNLKGLGVARGNKSVFGRAGITAALQP
jgi:hypothetical protein